MLHGRSPPVSQHTPLLQTFLNKLQSVAAVGPVLDLACGPGRNGLYLIEQFLPVVFADVNRVALGQIKSHLEAMPAEKEQLGSLWSIDLEQPGINPFQERSFGGIMVFHYLHRPLFELIKQAVLPGGIVIYETFTVDQPQFGRPKNPDFLLRPGELQEHFSDWENLHYFEGIVEKDSGEGSKAIAQLVAKKPI